MNISPISQRQDPIPNCSTESYWISSSDSIDSDANHWWEYCSCLICINLQHWILVVFGGACTLHTRNLIAVTLFFLTVSALPLFKIVQVQQILHWSMLIQPYVIANKKTLLKRQNLHSTAKNSTVVSTDRSAATRSTPWRSRRLASNDRPFVGLPPWLLLKSRHTTNLDQVAGKKTDVYSIPIKTKT